VFSGLASWFSLALKSAFAVVGMAVLIEIVLQLFYKWYFPHNLGRGISKR
jgi:hypothetical protein